MCQWFGPIISDKLAGPGPDQKHLRSDTQGKLPIPHCNLFQVCDSSIRYAGPRLWNELPQHLWSANSLKTFRSLLKAHLFKKSYDC